MQKKMHALPLHPSQAPPLPHHHHGVASELYATAYDCSSLRSGEADASALLSEVMEFYDEYGYVVLQGVFNAEECEQTRNAMWDILEEANPSMKRDDLQSWSALKSKGRYGLSTRGPSFHPRLVSNRQHPVLVRLLALLTEAGREENVIVSHDRFTIYRATLAEGDSEEQKKEFSTGEKNLHLDLSPWWWEEDSLDVTKGLDTIKYKDSQDFIKENNLVVKSLGRHVQCVLNFADNLADDGGTIVVPCFHRYLPTWNSVEKDLRKPLPWVTLPKDVEDRYMPYAQRISMREGSVLIWDQRVLHGTCPNRSTRCRLAQYLKAGPRDRTYAPRDSEGRLIEGAEYDPSCAHNARLLRRTRALRRELEKSGALSVVSPLGKYVFAFDILPDDDEQE